MNADDQRLIETVRDGVSAYWDAPSEYHSAIDALSARLERLDTLERALADAVRAYDAVLEAERQDAKMGYPLPGDSCIAIAMSLGADQTFAEIRTLLAEREGERT